MGLMSLSTELHIRLPQSLAMKLGAAAQKNRRSQNAEAAVAIQHWVAQQLTPEEAAVFNMLDAQRTMAAAAIDYAPEEPTGALPLQPTHRTLRRPNPDAIGFPSVPPKLPRMD